MTYGESARTPESLLAGDGFDAAIRPRAAVADDITELVSLRAVMLSSLGQEPHGEGAPWRRHAATWFGERLARPQDWAIRVVGPPGGHLAACGAAWVTEHLPGPIAPDGRRGYIGFMCTRPAARRRGHGSNIIRSLIEWLGGRKVARLELHASPESLDIYRRAGFSDDPYPAMYRMSGPFR